MVDEIVAAAAGRERGGEILQQVFAAFDDAGGGALHDGDRFVEIVQMAGQAAAGLKNAVAAAHAGAAQLAIEKILQAGARVGLVPGSAGVPADALGSGGATIR